MKVWYIITLLKLSGPVGIRVHIKTVKTIMKKFQSQSQQSSRYTVNTIQRSKLEVPQLFLSNVMRFETNNGLKNVNKPLKIAEMVTQPLQIK